MKAIDEAIKTLDMPYIKVNEIKSIINDLENLSSRIKGVADKSNDDSSPALNRDAEDVKKIANRLRSHMK